MFLTAEKQSSFLLKKSLSNKITENLIKIIFMMKLKFRGTCHKSALLMLKK